MGNVFRVSTNWGFSGVPFSAKNKDQEKRVGFLGETERREGEIERGSERGGIAREKGKVGREIERELDRVG